MNPFSLVETTVSLFRLKLKRPFKTALGKKTETVNAAVRVRLRGEETGYGEASSSVVWASTGPTLLASTLGRLGREFYGRDARDLTPEIWKSAGAVPPAASAFECALAAASARAARSDLWRRFGGAKRRLRTDITLSAEAPAAARAAAREAFAQGFRTFKIKVGTTGDFARVQAVHAAGPNLRIILDGNQKLGLTRALRLVERCLHAGIRIVLLEQPVAADNIADLLACSRRCLVPVAADESLRSIDDARRILDGGAGTAFNIKLSKTGLAASHAIAALAKTAGAPLMIGCMQESAAGLEPSASLAAGTGWFQFVDLDSDHLLEDGPSGAFVRRGPVLTLR